MNGDFLSDKTSNVSNWWLARILDFLSSNGSNFSSIVSLLTQINNNLTFGSVVLSVASGSASNTTGVLSIPNLKSILIRNTGNSPMTVSGFTVREGEVLELSGEFIAYIGAISYDCTGTSMEYIYMVG